ncbi:MAG: YgiT-type zinc finger protein [Chloroflexi bacterium]|nr:YgiT-type zinc finger protein [Chloroflexota bacterium]
MRCTACGGKLRRGRADLPFRVGVTSTVVLENVPVLRCVSCQECLLEGAVLGQVDEILAGADGTDGRDAQSGNW